MAKVIKRGMVTAERSLGRPSVIPESAKGLDVKRDKVQTVKLFKHEHDRLRKMSYECNTSHQDIIVTALLQYLSKEGY